MNVPVPRHPQKLPTVNTNGPPALERRHRLVEYTPDSGASAGPGAGPGTGPARSRGPGTGADRADNGAPAREAADSLETLKAQVDLLQKQLDAFGKGSSKD